MPNPIDKIIKENITAFFRSFLISYLNLKVAKVELLKDKMQVTFEKETDYIIIITTHDRQKFIFHLECEVANNRKLIWRMVIYFGVLKYKHAYPVRQYVLYLGHKSPAMPTKIPEGEPYRGGYELISLRDIPFRKLLESKVPEQVITAVLADYGGVKPKEAVRLILVQLKKICSQRTLGKYTRQLTVIGSIRNLTGEIFKQIAFMELTYDYSKDPLYKQGVRIGEKKGEKRGQKKGEKRGERRGEKRGIDKGEKIGIEKGEKKVVANLLRNTNFTVNKIAEVAGVSEEFVKRVKKMLSQK